MPHDPTSEVPGWRPDWTDAGAYRFTESLSVAQWAWEFLRRNPAYQRDWRWFDARWTELESAYGKPPDRDFQAWKRDPRAWVVAGEDEGECRVDQDKVLIECWMGAKWGFYKFPLDPATDNPVSPEQLTWRDAPTPVAVANSEDCDASAQAAARVPVLFELDLPLRPQIERVHRHLKSRQHRLRREGRLTLRTRSALAPHWRALLRCVDALCVGATPARIGAVLDDAAGAMCTVNDLIEAAERLAGGGHRWLLTALED
jgi:hypothetical protein